MEIRGEVKNNKEVEKLPAGFRFHPTDEELITCYLINKISDANFTGRAIGDVDLNKCEPWDLPGKAKMGEKEWYFFSLRDRKYPTGVRTNRATNTGYWKTTGKDKEIYDSNSTTLELVGMKKTLVFYKGRAPRGEKTNWVMHEYRIHSKSAFRNCKQDEWVVCRVFQKSSGGAKKYPNPIRASSVINPYNINLEYLPQNPILQPQQILTHHHQPAAVDIINSFHHEFPAAAGIIRNYNMMTPSQIQELNKVFMISSSSTTTTSSSTSMINNLPIPPPPQLISYAGAGNEGPAGCNGCFTISGLNLNLGAVPTDQPPPPPPLMRLAPPPQLPPPPQDVTSLGLMHDQHGAGYGGDMSSGDHGMSNNNNNRFMVMDQCADLDNYWPSY